MWLDICIGRKALPNSSEGETMTSKFTPGQEIEVRSISDYDCIFRFTVVSRTAKFVTFEHYNDERRCGIKLDRDGNEYAYPLGSFSMAPVARAENAKAVTA
jgi:hypothetical protein